MSKLLKNKLSRYKLYGLLQLVKLASKPWEVILWDFIIKLPKLKDPITGQEYDSIFIIVDKFTKWGYFIAYTEEILIEDIVQVYIKKVFSRNRALDKIY